MKNKFIKSTIILILGGFATKILAMVIKIYLTRSISPDGVSLYMLILPTFNLFITLSTLSLTTSTSKIISEKNNGAKKIILGSFGTFFIYNIFLMILIILLAPIISKYMLGNTDTYYPIMAISLTLPFIYLSSLLRGYFFGRERMFPHVLSNILEQLIRLILTIYFIPFLLKRSLVFAVTGVVLINIISEFSSSVLLILFMPKSKIKLSDFRYDKNIIKDILNISIPSTGSKLIGSISYFLEPIIITYILLGCGYDYSYIMREYGIITGYVYPLLLLPSFFTFAISNALLPVISKGHAMGKRLYVRKKLKEAIFICLLIGIPSTALIMLFPKFFLENIFNTTLGIKYIMVASPLFIFHYIQSPLTITLGAIGKAGIAMRGTLISSIIKTLLLATLCLFKIGLWPLIIASSINIIFVTFHHLYFVKKYI